MKEEIGKRDPTTYAFDQRFVILCNSWHFFRFFMWNFLWSGFVKNLKYMSLIEFKCTNIHSILTHDTQGDFKCSQVSPRETYFSLCVEQVINATDNECMEILKNDLSVFFVVLWNFQSKMNKVYLWGECWSGRNAIFWAHSKLESHQTGNYILSRELCRKKQMRLFLRANQLAKWNHIFIAFMN